MARKKPLSSEEKSTKLLEIFHETNDVFQLRDLERIAPKEKGIVQQSVKCTLQELVESGKVRSEKISGSIYFWSFPSETLNATKQLLAESIDLNTQLQNKIDHTEKQLQTHSESLSGNDASEIVAVESEIEILKKEKKELQQSIAATANDIDYTEIAIKEQDTKKILEAANRWTDNIFSIKTWCKRKFDKQDREMDKAFGIPEDLDYLDV